MEGVVACPHQRDVVSLVRVDEVVPVPADEDLGAAAAEQGVVTGTTVDRDRLVRKAPFDWSMRTTSLPPPALTLIARSTETSAVPSSPTSTSSTVGTPAWSRSASLSLAPLPVIWSVPATIWAV
jgi:hypothetical protein